MRKEIWKIITAIGVLALAFILVWINRFQYEHAGSSQVLVRINRFTGQGCFLLGTGVWDSRLVPAKDDVFAKNGGQETEKGKTIFDAFNGPQEDKGNKCQ